MGNRIDELEQSINDLKAEMGVEGSPSPSVPSKPKVEPKSEGSPAGPAGPASPYTSKPDDDAV